MNNYIKGNFRKIIFQSDKGYTIGLFKVRDTNDNDLNDYINKTITFTGYFHDLKIDEVYIFYGALMEHERYGMQYQVESYERVKPESKEGIIEFLSSELFPGVGLKMATKIVDTLGDDTIKLILENYRNLLVVSGITEKKALKIHDILDKYEESEATIIYLCNLGFALKDSLAIYNLYKKTTEEVIGYNIYQIIDHIEEINFSKVDNIALNMDYSMEDSNRIKYGIIHAMKNICFKNGDTYLYIDEIIAFLNKELSININLDKLISYINLLKEDKKIVIVNDKYYLKEYWDSEINIKEIITYFVKNKKSTKDTEKIDKYIDNLEKTNNIIYNDKQKEAIKSAILNNFIIITGGPGTGKTTIIKAIVELYIDINNLSPLDITKDIMLLAPTGRATKRMNEKTLMPAMTIHRYLKWDKDSNSFQINEYNKTNEKFIIIDEVSMIDTLLLDNLFKGINKDVKIVMVGDYNQLPSVSPGDVLKDLILSKAVKVVELEHLYRQSNNSYIPSLAYEVKEDCLSLKLKEKHDDFLFIESPSINIKNMIKELINKAIDKTYSYKNIQVLAPIYRGENGIDKLNIILQELFNPKDNNKKEIKVGDIIYREGDKILQLVNEIDLNVFNGDIGIITNINYSSTSQSGKNEIEIDFDGWKVLYKPKDFINITHGYAISIHKAQGSEFDIVIMPIDGAYHSFFSRKIIYTGITRAKKSLILIGSEEVLRRGIRNTNNEERKTGLQELIKNNKGDL